MKFLYSWFKDYIALRESPEKLAEILNLYAFETSVQQKLPGRDAILDVELFPNRVGDAASHVGVARELSMILRRPLKWKLEKVKEAPILGSQTSQGSPTSYDFVSVKVEDSKLCPRYSARVVTGVKVGPSPLWLKKRLAACGLRPINNAVDITNYVMLELGEPLHAFDWDKLVGSGQSAGGSKKQIIVRRAKQREAIETLDSAHCTLHTDDLVIADASGPLALAGIKGGKRAEITRKTKHIVLEAANFDPIAIRKTSKRLGLRTDSSWRFENGLDANLTTVALERAAALIQEICGGEVARGIVDFYPKKVLPQPIVVGEKQLQLLIGAGVGAREAVSRLKPILVSANIRSGQMFLRVRTERRDLLYPEDIIEEAARLFGYNRLPPVVPVAALTLSTVNESLQFREILRDHLVSLGFSEVYNYSFASERDVDVLELSQDELVEVANPLSSETRYLRRYLLVNLLKNVRDNSRFFSEVRIFEVGPQYQWKRGLAEEQWRVSGVITRKGETAQNLFFEAKGLMESIFERLGLDRDDWQIRDVSDQHFVPGTAIEFSVGKTDVARIGVFRPEFSRAYDIDVPVACWIIRIQSTQAMVQEEHEYEAPHRYPDVIRDISMIVPAESRVEEIQNIIHGHGASPKYLEDIDLFDIYEDIELGEAKKSLAFHLVFRADDRTLTDEEVGKEMEKIYKALREFGAEIR